MNNLFVWFQIILMMAVPMIYIFRLHKLLIVGGRWSKRFDYSAALVAAAGLLVVVAESGRKYSLAVLTAFASPMLHSHAFKKMFFWFVRRTGREPADVWMEWRGGFFWGRVFAFAVFLGFLYPSVALFMYLHWLN